MLWELLEAVINCMIAFQVLNFDPVKEILKIIKYILIQEYQHKLIRVNTNQHESGTS